MKFKTAFSIFCLCSSFSILPLAIFLESASVISEDEIIEAMPTEEYSSQNCSFLQSGGEFLVCRVSDNDSRAILYFQGPEDVAKNYWRRIQKFEMLDRDESNEEINLNLYIASAKNKVTKYKTKKFPQIFFVSFRKNRPIILENHCKLELKMFSANLSCTTEDQSKNESKSAQIIFSRLDLKRKK